MGEVISMLKRVILFDVLIGVVLSIIIQLVFKAYVLTFLLGLIVASISFALSGLVVGNIFLNKKFKFNALVTIINSIKILIICIIALLVFNNNINNVISYILGFTSHFIALVLYGIFNLLNERK